VRPLAPPLGADLLPKAVLDVSGRYPCKVLSGPEHDEDLAPKQVSRTAEPELDTPAPTAGNAAITRALRQEGMPPRAAAGVAGNAAMARLMRVQRSELAVQGDGPLDGDIAAAIESERGGGAALPETVRGDMEAHLGVDLGEVRVHSGSTADTLNRSVTAEAFTSGTDVFFSSGKYDPGSSSGRELLAHELTHVVQQSAGAAGPDGEVSHPGDAAEVAARASGAAFGSGQAAEVEHDGRSPAVARSARVSRQPHPGGGGGGKAGPKPVPHVDAAPTPLNEANQTTMPPSDRKQLELAAVGFIPMAFTAFGAASSAHAAAIKNAAKAEAEMIAAVIDVATGFMAPVFANWAVSKMAAKAATAGAEIAKKAAPLLSKPDLFKATFTGATKVANQVIKTQSNALFGETEIDTFARGLRNTFQAGAGEILNHVASMTDDELLVIWLAYSPENADESQYLKVLDGLFKRYQAQVQTIGERADFGTEGGGNGAETGLYEIQTARGKRLANVTAWDSGEFNLMAWVTPDMEAMARAKAAHFGGVKQLPLAKLNATLAEILNPPHPEWRKKDTIDVIRAMSPGERAAAAGDPDVITIIEHGREIDGRVPGQYERHKSLFILRGFSNHATAALDELDSFFPSATTVDKHLKDMGAAERGRLAADPWFVGQVKKELGGYGLEQVLFTLGLGPEPKEPDPVSYPMMPIGF
jgi:Domain of unknown function (DUF4157)